MDKIEKQANVDKERKIIMLLSLPSLVIKNLFCIVIVKAKIQKIPSDAHPSHAILLYHFTI